MAAWWCEQGSNPGKNLITTPMARHKRQGAWKSLLTLALTCVYWLTPLDRWTERAKQANTKGFAHHVSNQLPRSGNLITLSGQACLHKQSKHLRSCSLLSTWFHPPRSSRDRMSPSLAKLTSLLPFPHAPPPSLAMGRAQQCR